MPHIEEVTFFFDGPSGQIQRETCFRMNKYDIRCWFIEEEHIINVACVIQLRYGIPGSLPPKPSSFHFDRAHKTHKIAKRMICLTWEWFAIWMGFLSYFIAKTVSLFFPMANQIIHPQPRTGTTTCGTCTTSPILGLTAFFSPMSAHLTWERHELE
jgi:hypothetical protein